jgi:hypothetical protein
LFLRKQAERKKQILIKWVSPIAWQNFNLLGRFEFYRQQNIINIDEMISLLEQKIIWQQPKVTEESASVKSCFTFLRG